MKRVTVGLTGGIGAGKSTVGRMLLELGAEVVSGDELGREVLEQDVQVQSELVSRLGSDIKAVDGSLDRKLIAQRAFQDRETSEWLTKLTFPGINGRWLERKRGSMKSVVVLDAALIFEWGIESEFDIVLVIRAPVPLAVSRSIGRIPEADLLKRFAAQLSVDIKAATATFVIDNGGTHEALETRVREFWDTYIQPRIA